MSKLYNLIIQIHNNIIDKAIPNQTTEWREHYKIGGRK